MASVSKMERSIKWKRIGSWACMILAGSFWMTADKMDGIGYWVVGIIGAYLAFGAYRLAVAVGREKEQLKNRKKEKGWALKI